MLVMQEETSKPGPPNSFTTGEALDYLRRERGIIITAAALRMRRMRGKIMGGRVVAKKVTLWTKEELDALEVFPKTRRSEQLNHQNT